MKVVIFLIYFFALKFHGQKPKVIIAKSTITTIGSKTVYPKFIQNKNYEIHQSIGQSSIIGKKNIDNISIQQGFLTKNKRFDNNNNNSTDFIHPSLDIVISPNPFIDHIKINFSKVTASDIQIHIYDLSGKLLFSKKHKPTDTIFVPFRYYRIGGYLLHIQSGKIKFTTKLLKTALK